MTIALLLQKDNLRQRHPKTTKETLDHEYLSRDNRTGCAARHLNSHAALMLDATASLLDDQSSAPSREPLLAHRQLLFAYKPDHRQTRTAALLQSAHARSSAQ